MSVCTFHGLTGISEPGLRVWRPGAASGEELVPLAELDPAGRWINFRCRLESERPGPLLFLLYQRATPAPRRGKAEADTFTREMPRDAAGRFLDEVWFAQGASRVLDHDPSALAGLDSVRVHLITGARYERGKLYAWGPYELEGRQYEAAGADDLGPFFDVPLDGDRRTWFLFKFQTANGDFEPDQANRLWTAHDGQEVWTVQEAPQLVRSRPTLEPLVVHFRQEIGADHPPLLHVWKDHSSYAEDVEGVLERDGWYRHQVKVWTGFPYRCQFWNPTLSEHRRWEHQECVREVKVEGPEERWTLEGDAHWFDHLPRADRRIIAEIACSPPSCDLTEPTGAGVWINRARGWLHQRVDAKREGGCSQFEFDTYPDVPTSLRLEGEGIVEELDRHVVTVPRSVESLKCYLVVEREGTLTERPPENLFADPGFEIKRPGVTRENGRLRFVVAAPQASRVRLVTDEDHGLPLTIDMHSTRDGSFWWTEIDEKDIQEVKADGEESDGRWRYRIILDEEKKPVTVPSSS